MKKILTFIMLIGSLIIAQTGFNAIGGITYSIFAGDDNEHPLTGENPDNLLGFKFGAEKTLTNGYIVGATYSQRGGTYSTTEPGLKYNNDIKINYLTGYFLKPFPMQKELDLLVGWELGYFLNGSSKEKLCINNNCETNTSDIDADDWKNADNNMIDYGLVLGGRYSINEQIYLVGTYYWGLFQTGDAADVKHRSFQFYLSYGL